MTVSDFNSFSGVHGVDAMRATIVVTVAAVMYNTVLQPMLQMQAVHKLSQKSRR